MYVCVVVRGKEKVLALPLHVSVLQGTCIAFIGWKTNPVTLFESDLLRVLAGVEATKA